MSSTTQIQKPDRTDGREARAVTPNQLARRVGVSIHCILALIRAGELRAKNWAKPGATRKRWKIYPEDLAEFEQARSSKPAPPTRRKKKAPKDPNFVEFY